MANSWVQRFATALIPGSSAFFAPPSVKEPSKTDMQRALAYVDPSRLTAQWNTTPYNSGWLVTRKGMQIFDQMKRDEQVKAALKFKTDSVLSAGWEVVSPGDQDEDWEVTKLVRDALAFVPGGWNTVLVAVLSALAYGFSTQERVYEQKDLGEWKGKLLFTRVQSVKPHFIDFVTDPYGVLLGVTQQLTATVGDPMPPAKFIIFSHTKEFGNYYGTSDLEACYRAWWTKDNAYKWLAVTLERYGMAPLFAMYDPNSYQGNAVEELKKIVKGIQNASLGVIPRATKDALELWSQSLNKGSSELFLMALDRFDQHIARAILVPDLVGMSSNTGQTGSLARSRTNFDSFMQVVTQLQNDVAAQVMNAQVIPQLCDLNFPSLQSYPLFRFLPFSDDKKLEIMTTWASLVGGQVVNKIEDDETHIRKVMGFPENENPEVLPNPEQPPGGVGPDGKPIVKKPNPFEKKEFHLPGRHDQESHGNDAGEFNPKDPIHRVLRDNILKKIRDAGGELTANEIGQGGSDFIWGLVDAGILRESQGYFEIVGEGFKKNTQIPDTDLSEEMRAFAEEHDAVWVEMEDGQRAAVQREETTV